MSSIAVINNLVGEIIKEGQHILHGKFIQKQKVPTFVKNAFQSNNHQFASHNGYMAEISKNSNMKKQKMPSSIHRDQFSTKSTKVQKNNKTTSFFVPGSVQKSKRHNRSRNSSFRYSQNKKNKSQIIKNMNQQSGFIQLTEDYKPWIATQRKRINDQIQQKIRQKKINQSLRQYQQKKASQMIQKTKKQRKQMKQHELNIHINRGKDHGFYFDDEGNVALYRAAQSYRSKSKIELAKKQLRYNIPADQNNENNKKIIQNQIQTPCSDQNQKIKSARGLAFASTILKTVNMSRASMNQSYRQTGVDEFMHRNDLFNNNHIRQTTSIPYITATQGTIYKQLTTNQFINENKSQTKNNTRKRCVSTSRSYFKQISATYNKNQIQKNRGQISKTENIYQNINDSTLIEDRNAQTADKTKRKAIYERRSLTSRMKTGKIINFNQKQFQNLIS